MELEYIYRDWNDLVWSDKGLIYYRGPGLYTNPTRLLGKYKYNNIAEVNDMKIVYKMIQCPFKFETFQLWFNFDKIYLVGVWVLYRLDFDKCFWIGTPQPKRER